MSHHSQNNAHIKQVLMDVISISMSHIQDLALKLKELNVTDENLAQKSADEKQKAMVLNNLLTVINDAIHPAHDLAIEFFPGASDFIKLCKDNHKLAIQRKLISPTCGCYMCKIENPL